MDIDGFECDLLRLLPQRPPFLLVDRIRELSEERICTERAVTTEDFLTVSGNYLIENMAQSASALFGYRRLIQKRNYEHMYLAAIDESLISRLPEPGDRLVTEIEVVITAGSLARVKGKSYLEDEVVATSTLVLYVS